MRVANGVLAPGRSAENHPTRGRNVPLPMSRRDGFCLVALATLTWVMATPRLGSASKAERKTLVVKAVERAQASVVSISSEKKAGSAAAGRSRAKSLSAPG